MNVNRKRAFEAMKEHSLKTNTNYDYIVNLRLDCLNQTIINYNQIVKNTNLSNNILENIVFVPEKYNWLNGVNDQFAFGKFHSMKEYMSLIDNIDNIFDNHPFLNSENLLKFHLEEKNILVVRIPFEYEIIR